MGGIGGVAPAAFGLQVVGADGQLRLRTAYGPRGAGATQPLRLTYAPAPVGAVRAGPFMDLRVQGEIRRGRLRASSAYRFTPNAISARWTVHGRRPGERAHVTFPSWGGRTRVHAALRDGRRVRLGQRPRSLDAIVSLDLGGYTVRPLDGPHGGRVRVARSARSRSAPDPGPTLVVDLPAARHSLTVELMTDGR